MKNPCQSVSPCVHAGRCDYSILGETILQNKDFDLDQFEHGITVPKMLPDPGAPSRQEVLEHELTHLPFRAWCPYCVAARGKDMKHAVDKWKEPNALPVVAVDYAFMNKTKEDNSTSSSITTLVVKDQKSKHVFGIPVPRKGVDEDEFATRML